MKLYAEVIWSHQCTSDFRLVQLNWTQNMNKGEMHPGSDLTNNWLVLLIMYITLIIFVSSYIPLEVVGNK
jgi:hypothetical protein